MQPCHVLASPSRLNIREVLRLPCREAVATTCQDLEKLSPISFFLSKQTWWHVILVKIEENFQTCCSMAEKKLAIGPLDLGRMFFTATASCCCFVAYWAGKNEKCGGFLKWGNGKSENNMDDLGIPPWLRKPPCNIMVSVINYPLVMTNIAMENGP